MKGALHGDVFAAVGLDCYYTAIVVLANAVMRLACIVHPARGVRTKTAGVSSGGGVGLMSGQVLPTS